jgi:hypothetical protein
MILGIKLLFTLRVFVHSYIRGIVHVVETCVCSEFAVSAVRAYLCSVGKGWVGNVILRLR